MRWEIKTTLNGEDFSRVDAGTNPISARLTFERLKHSMGEQGYTIKTPPGCKRNHFIARDESNKFDVWLIEAAPALN